MVYPILYAAITNHGFGHATRTAAVVAEVKRRCPEITVILTTTAPRWLLEAYIPGDFIHRPRAFDVGIIQSDSITMDKAETLARLRHIQQQARSLTLSEANFLQQNRVGLVLADIPPLAAPIARAAGVPCWMMSNFGWDFIYRPWGGEFAAIADWIGECFAQCNHLFRLPFHESLSAFASLTDVGLTGGSPRFALEDLKAKFDLTVPRSYTVLLSFGGLGLNEIPYENLSRFPNWQFLSFDRNAPDLPNLRKITDRAYRPVDVMPLCHCVVSKPGFSTFSEACRLDVPIISITRGDFAEAALLIDGIQNHAYHQILDPTEFFQGDWEFLRHPLHPPRSNQPLDKDGNGAIATAIIDYLQGQA